MHFRSCKSITSYVTQDTTQNNSDTNITVSSTGIYRCRPSRMYDHRSGKTVLWYELLISVPQDVL